MEQWIKDDIARGIKVIVDGKILCRFVEESGRVQIGCEMCDSEKYPDDDDDWWS